MQEAVQCIPVMDFMKDWISWRKSLHEGIAAARQLGFSEEKIRELAIKVGDFLTDKVCPGTKEDELLKEMWGAASPDERKVLATILFKMVK